MMKTKQILSLGALFCVILTNSCSLNHPIGYRTTTPQITQFSERNEFNATSQVGLNHMEVQVGYAPIKHMGIMANAYLGSDFRTSEIGVGGNYTIKKFNFELYGLKGSSILDQYKTRELEPINYYAKKRIEVFNMSHEYYTKSLQLNTTFMEEFYSFSCAFKYTFAKYAELNYSYLNADVKYNQELIVFDDNSYSSTADRQFYALSFQATVGARKFRVFAQYTINRMVGEQFINPLTPPYYKRDLASLGLMLKLGKPKKKITPNNI
ncbi:MAG: hypothetical protein R2809_04535 [Flavobacteriales bacterium]